MAKRRRKATTVARDKEEAELKVDTLEQLINQFSDPYAFLRELVQNAIDSASPRVDIRFEFRPSKEGPKGIFIIHIDDTGCGMTRKDIDVYLKRLWNSSKDDDPTMIGKFGIGFVSIFAMKPNGVILDTSRGNEAWRVFFREDRTFDRIELAKPFAGTHIQWIKEIDNDKLAQMIERCKRTLALWCKFCRAEISVDGQLINQQFGLEAPYALAQDSPGLRVAVAPSLEEKPFFGFYCHGLTLHEGREARFPGVSFLLDCDTLTHTVTRDNVMHNEHYHRAMAKLGQVVTEQLRPRLFEAASICEDPSELDRLYGYLSFQLAQLAPSLEKTPLLPTLAGPRISLAQLRHSAWNWGLVYWDSCPSPEHRQLQAQAIPILCCPGVEGGLAMLLRAALPTTPLQQASKAPPPRRPWLPKALAVAAGLITLTAALAYYLSIES